LKSPNVSGYLKPHHMKLFCIISLTVMLLCCTQGLFATSTDSTKIISVDADVVALDESIHLKFPGAKANEYFIVITLTNNQDTMVHFQIMTCSWNESFVFDKDSFYLFYPGCDGNYPITIDIAPHKSIKFFSKLQCYKKEDDTQHPLAFKIGFVDLPYDSFFHRYSKKDKSKYKTYWSNSIYLESKLYHYKEEKPVSEISIEKSSC
jgi:hypothetical protein